MSEETDRLVSLLPAGTQLPAVDRDRWLRSAVGRLGSSTGYAFDIRQSPASRNVYEIIPQQAPTPVLQLQFAGSSVQADLCDYQTQDEVDRWRMALRAALKQTLEQTQELSWQAIIDVARIPGQPNSTKLPNGLALKPFELVVSPHRYMDMIPISDFGAEQLRITWPARLSGTARGRDQGEASRQAAADARLVCAMLSVTSGLCLAVRSPIFDASLGGPPFPVTNADIEEQYGDGNYPEPRQLRAASWYEGALLKLRDETDLANALIAFHEALLLAPRHPSMAVVGLVAAIESIGARHIELTRCTCCDACPTKQGYTRRFREMLGKVLHPVEAKKVESAYVKRSGTAHAGTLFAHDRRMGLGVNRSMLSINPEQEFSDDLIRSLEKACRRLLALEMGGKQNWKLTEDDMPQGLIGGVMSVVQLPSGSAGQL